MILSPVWIRMIFPERTALRNSYHVFENNPQLDICGSDIDEFEDTPDEIVANRTVPCNT